MHEVLPLHPHLPRAVMNLPSILALSINSHNCGMPFALVGLGFTQSFVTAGHPANPMGRSMWNVTGPPSAYETDFTQAYGVFSAFTVIVASSVVISIVVFIMFSFC
jgi:hypothetical protein